ncbi:MAG: 3-oxoacyl-[acyl-carrier-protein] reductase [Magnetococcales bacterium]|nr:3-oxoacyl-[acyl-carrier-protein] reductase [Magnetococcales bacterium]
MLNDRVAIVTGSTRGIGLIAAKELAKRGATPVITSIEGDLIPGIVEELKEIAPNTVGFEADVTKRDQLQELVKFTMDTFGRIDILVNNAGITKDGLFMRMKPADWELVMQINLTSIFNLTQLVIRPMMKARYGRIVNIASVVGLTGNAGQANYTASKAGLIGFSKTVAREVASRGITVNCVAPGFIQTAMTDKLKPEARDAILSQIPMGSMGQSQDVANAIAFLASDDAAYITGETLSVNGGMYMG